MRAGLLALIISLFAVQVQAAVHTENLEYKDGQAVLEGYLAYDDSFAGKRPGILVVHEWKGLDEHPKDSARRLAQLGYVAFAVDVYGKGVRPKTNEEAGKEAGIYKNDRPLTRQRIQTALETFKGHELVDQSRLAVMGYCFGGMVALELARSGADIKGVVTFHGALNTPTPEDAKNIKAKVLVLHGAADPFVTPEEVKAFEEEMKKAGVNYRIVKYPGAVHAFTNPASGNDPAQGAAYNPEADQKSWEEMKEFFSQIFK